MNIELRNKLATRFASTPRPDTITLQAVKPPASVWKPTLTVQQKKEQEDYIKLHKLPF